MENTNYDKDLYSFFFDLIEDSEEVDLLLKILEGMDETTIIDGFIQMQEQVTNDKN